MRSKWIRMFAPIAILSLFSISCSLFADDVRPTQVVDLPSMVGKSLAEMTTMFGQPKRMGICHGWDLPEGTLSACFSESDRMRDLAYRFPPQKFFGSRISVRSPEEMAKIVKIDLQGRQPDSKFIGGYGYEGLTLNGKTVDVAFDGGSDQIVGVRIEVK